MIDHPLTDEICREVADSMIDFPNGFPDAHDHIRAGADYQLEQVIEWLRSADSRDYLWVWIDGDAEINKDELIADLRKAMRLQQQEDN